MCTCCDPRLRCRRPCRSRARRHVWWRRSPRPRSNGRRERERLHQSAPSSQSRDVLSDIASRCRETAERPGAPSGNHLQLANGHDSAIPGTASANRRLGYPRPMTDRPGSRERFSHSADSGIWGTGVNDRVAKGAGPIGCTPYLDECIVRRPRVDTRPVPCRTTCPRGRL